MAKRFRVFLLAVIVALCLLSVWIFLTRNSSQDTDPVILRIHSAEFTQSEILARMDLTCRKYHLTLADVQEDPFMWNKLAEDIIYEYAGAEIARDLCEQYGLGSLTEGELEEAELFYDSVLSDIESIGEDPETYLVQMGFSEESMKTYSEDQIYADKLTQYWANDLNLEPEDDSAQYQILLHYMEKTWEEIDARVAAGEYLLDLSPLLLETAENNP